MEISNRWLAWIPLANVYLMGKMTGYRYFWIFQLILFLIFFGSIPYINSWCTGECGGWGIGLMSFLWWGLLLFNIFMFVWICKIALVFRKSPLVAGLLGFFSLAIFGGGLGLLIVLFYLAFSKINKSN